ncbi:hypothetical protein N436_00100 [Pseudomonas sp. RV120224-01b]|nr:hypothetical protein N428_00100 [Pseudomonas sp. RV120224-01c]PYG86025.1 hypothetical protein N436_00100 [Pseudomonas sp. RV120224-01b]
MSDDMPILNLDLSNTKRFEASRFLDSPETVSVFPREALKTDDAQALKHAQGEATNATRVK